MRKGAAKICMALLLVPMLALGGNAIAETQADPGSQTDASETFTSVYTGVSLTGGSGKATIAEPAEIRVAADGTCMAVIRWSSSSFDYMIVDGGTYYPVSTEGGSVFIIPVPSENCTVRVQADTTAMSTPHLIDYTLTFGTDKAAEAEPEQDDVEITAPAAESTTFDGIAGLVSTGKLELSYAEKFTVDNYENGYALITVDGSERYLLVPEGGEVPETLPDGIAVLRQPLKNIYLVSSSAMDMFASCNGMEALHFCALDRTGWRIAAPVEAMDRGELVYAGRYSAPDYEMLRAGGCSLAIENMMISHSPEVVEKLNGLGIPVLIERSSYERTPEGRMEWIKLYGLLTGHAEEAEDAFEAQLESLKQLDGTGSTAKTAAVFYVTTSGTVSVRSASDYLPSMIERAGGTYVFDGLGTDSANATVNIQMEEFYAQAKDADYLFYNSTISGEIETLDDFLSINPLFRNMRAVKEGGVYCISRDLYQSSMSLGDFTLDLYHVFHGIDGELKYITKLK